MYLCYSSVKRSFYIHFGILYMLVPVHQVGTAVSAIAFVFLNSVHLHSN